ncbi:uncharacterized protein LOC112551876 [Alligator sinensis]|uniref:Uncharacterized protein LOC112551876 n=1 Tax=Alligator sinensis TaxID=38654 RepID=A0A3Q0HGP5_ALLSI|nr:uncharacterized protein LOC112551876 [Alligator sinensis]
MIHREELGFPGSCGLSTWLLAPISLPFLTSCSSPGGRERQLRDCPVWLPLLQIPGGSGMQLTPQPAPGRLRPTNRLVWVRACLLVQPPCCQEEGEDVGTGDVPRGKSQPLHPETLRHRQKLPRLAVQGVGLDRSCQSRPKVEAPRKKAVAQRDSVPCTPQQGLERLKEWPHPGLKPFAPQDLILKRAGPRATPNMSFRGKGLS